MHRPHRETWRLPRSESCIAVVSAMSGVTNCLIAAAQKAATGDSNEGSELVKILRTQHATAPETLIKIGKPESA